MFRKVSKYRMLIVGIQLKMSVFFWHYKTKEGAKKECMNNKFTGMMLMLIRLYE